jgi:hypothetical protein
MSKLTNAQKEAAAVAAMSTVEKRAFAAGEGRAALLASVANACGPRPNLALYERVRLAVCVGYMASALARKGDNRPEGTLLKHCRERITVYAGHGGTGKLRKGQKGRRTEVEEAAYTSARNLVSRVMADAGVKVPTKSGSNSNSKAKAAAKKGATGKRTEKKAANDGAPAIRKFGKAEAFVQYALIQGKALQGSLNKSAACVPSRAGEAINHFLTEMLAVADELGMRV